MGRKKNRDWLSPPDWWKKYRPVRLLALGLLGYGIWSWIGVGQEVVKSTRVPHPDTGKFTAVLADPVALIAPFKSFQSVEDTFDVLSAGGYAWRGVRIPTPGSHRYPPRNLQTVVVSGYLHLDVPGQLTLEFFNDRLYEASFIPDDAPAYAPKLPSIGLKANRGDNGRATIIDGPRRVVSNVQLAITEVGRNLRTTPRVIWQDTRLIEQRDSWDIRFATAYAEAALDND